MQPTKVSLIASIFASARPGGPPARLGPWSASLCQLWQVALNNALTEVMKREPNLPIVTLTLEVDADEPNSYFILAQAHSRHARQPSPSSVAA